VLPSYSVMGQLQKILAHGWNLQAGIRHSEYTKFYTDIATLTAERYWTTSAVLTRCISRGWMAGVPCRTMSVNSTITTENAIRSA
jgi:hypothetical protein